MKIKDVTAPGLLREADEMALEELAQDVRREILSAVSQNGGHLASNLGVVELTLALYSVFDFSRDQLVWDVGHQCYTHKILTGRHKNFSTLRKTDGVCGFPRREESEYDLFNTGHSSSALSQALGLCRARDLKGEKHHVVAVVGDGAMTGGMCYEALNDLGSAGTGMICVVNDNGMSISGNVGALSNYLTYMRTSKGWQTLKRTTAHLLLRIPFIGKKLYKMFLSFKDHVRNVFVKDTFFSSLGIRYLGPIDGHDIGAMKRILRRAADMHEPVVVHVITRKGKGYAPAEERPEDFHGTPPFDPETGVQKKEEETFGEAACRYLCRKAEGDGRIVAVTAAMTAGTGFHQFAKQFPKRLIDVGIAEEHAVTMAGGMARGGLRPVVAIYDSFMQRAYDQMLEDICAQKLPVLLLLDRAGIGGSDGASHHGVFGTSYLCSMPGMTVCYPRCKNELEKMIDFALVHDGPVAICYPRGGSMAAPAYRETNFRPGRWETLREGSDACILAVGSMCAQALCAADMLEKDGLHVRVMNASCVSHMDEALLMGLNQRGTPVFTVEENVLSGGFGSRVSAYCVAHGLRAPGHIFALGDDFIPHGDRQVLLARQGLDAESIANTIRMRIHV